MKTIGITGGTGAGKTTVLRYLESLGAVVIDCDAVYHQLLISSTEMKRELTEQFGDILTGGVVDRKRLGAVVFGNEEALQRLNEITHTYVYRQVLEILRREKRQGRQIAAIDAILLIESGLGDLCNRVVGVIAPRERRLARIMRRDAIDVDYANARINAQKPDDFFIQNCDMILENDYDDLEAFYEVCKEFLDCLLSDISAEEEF